MSVNCVDAVLPVLGPNGLRKGPCKLLRTFPLRLAPSSKIQTTDWYNRVPKGVPGGVITLQDPAEHKDRRRIWDRAFNTSAVKIYEEVVVDKTRELVEQLERRAGQEIDFSRWMSYFS